MLVASVLAVTMASSAHSADKLEARVRTLVHQRFAEGVPEAEVRALAGEADRVTGLLVAMLSDPAEDQAHVTAVTILGMIGTAEAVEPLQEYLTGARGEVRVERLRALLMVPEALGMIAGRQHPRGTATSTTLAFLERLVVDPPRLEWHCGAYRGEALQTLVAKVAVNGLGRSGTARARRFLQALSAREDRSALRPNLDEALMRLDGKTVPDARLQGARTAPAVDEPGPATDRSTTVVSLSINRHTATSFSNSTADSTLSTATTLLKTNDHGCTDEVACDVQVSRSGSVGTFGTTTDGLDVITTEAELTTVLGKTGSFKVVTSAQSCCGVAGSILGCGRLNEMNTVILASADPDIWLHELGHNKGLSHSDSCSKYIMHSTAASTNAVTSSECTSFSSRTLSAGGPASP